MDAIRKSAKKGIDRFTHIDVLMSHWPVTLNDQKKDGNLVVDTEHSFADVARQRGDEKGSYFTVWKNMKELVREGLCRAIGVSNCSIVQLEELAKYAEGPEDIPISCNQVEVSPLLPNTELLEYQKRKGILCMSYSVFAGQKPEPKLLDYDEVKKNGGADALLAWVLAKGTVPVLTTEKPERMASNLLIKARGSPVLDKVHEERGFCRTVDRYGVFS